MHKTISNKMKEQCRSGWSCLALALFTVLACGGEQKEEPETPVRKSESGRAPVLQAEAASVAPEPSLAAESESEPSEERISKLANELEVTKESVTPKPATAGSAYCSSFYNDLRRMPHIGGRREVHSGVIEGALSGLRADVVKAAGSPEPGFDRLSQNGFRARFVGPQALATCNRVRRFAAPPPPKNATGRRRIARSKASPCVLCETPEPAPASATSSPSVKEK